MLAAWNDEDPERVRDVITTDYLGHLLYLADGARTAVEYPQWIRDYRSAFPETTFRVVEQVTSGDRLWNPVQASRPGGGGVEVAAHGVNISRFTDDLIAAEWAVWSPWL